MWTRYKVYRENGQFLADVARRKYWLFGPWVTDVYENRGVQWRCRRTGKSPFVHLYYDLELQRYWIMNGGAE